MGSKARAQRDLACGSGIKVAKGHGCVTRSVLPDFPRSGSGVQPYRLWMDFVTFSGKFNAYNFVRGITSGGQDD